MDNNMYGNNGVVNGQFGGPVQMMPQPQQVKPVNCDTQMNITTLADLQSYAAGTVVRFPDFAEGQPLVARVRRPSMLVLAKQGKIPNSLLKSAADLFSKGGSSAKSDENTLSELYDVCHIICEACLIQP